MTNTTTKTGVATLKQLNKECLKIDLTEVRNKKGWEDKTIYINTDEYGENPYIKFGEGRPAVVGRPDGGRIPRRKERLPDPGHHGAVGADLKCFGQGT